MKAQKIVLRTVYCLAGFLFLASVGYNILQHQQFKKFFVKPDSGKITQNKTDSDPLSGSESNPAKTDKKADLESATPAGLQENLDTGEAGELEYHLNAAKEELDITNDQLSEELSKKEEFKKAYYQPSRNNSDPVYKKIRRDSITKLINEDYAPLFKKLNITEEEFDKLKEILFDKRMEIDDLSEPYLNAATTEEKETVIQQQRDIDNNYKNRIAEFLGEEKNEIYQSYENRHTERIRLNDFMMGQPADKRINEEQTESLIDAMYDARKVIYDEKDTEKNESSSGLTEEKIAQSMEMQSRVNEKYVEASSGIMPPDQLEQYKTYLKQQLDMTESVLKMSLYLNENK